MAHQSDRRVGCGDARAERGGFVLGGVIHHDLGEGVSYDFPFSLIHFYLSSYLLFFFFYFFSINGGYITSSVQYNLCGFRSIAAPVNLGVHGFVYDMWLFFSWFRDWCLVAYLHTFSSLSVLYNGRSLYINGCYTSHIKYRYVEFFIYLFRQHACGTLFNLS